MKAAQSPTVAQKDLRARLREQLESKYAAARSDSPLEPPASSRIGKVLDGRYRVNELLGVGGMGTVYLAQDLELDDKVALKLLRRDVVDVPGALERFRREVKLARRVTHPNVSRTYDIASDGDDLFITMEPIAGNTLARVAKGPQLDDRTIAQIGLQICAGLNAAHRAGVIHRDLKPQNVMLEPMGADAQRVVIMDFGIAQSSKLERDLEDAHERAAELGQVVGTPAYMAPEQLSGKAVDQRADLCSLGIVLFELFTGVLPWRGETPSTTALARLRLDAPDPRNFRRDLPDTLAEITLHCLTRAPEQRPASAANVALELKAWLRATDSHPSRPLIWLPPSVGDERPTLTSHGLSEVNAALEPHSAALAPSQPVSSKPAPAPASSRAQAAKSRVPSIAVVPHVPSEPSQACPVLDELCEEVVDQLSTAPGLRVRPLGSVISLQRENPNWDAERLGRALEVDFVVEAGASAISGECVLRTRLLDVGHDIQLWADRVRTSRSHAIEACEQAARTAVAAVTSRALEDPEFNTWLDQVPEDAERSPPETASKQSVSDDALPHENTSEVVSAAAPESTESESAEGGAPGESPTRGGRVLSASA